VLLDTPPISLNLPFASEARRSLLPAHYGQRGSHRSLPALARGSEDIGIVMRGPITPVCRVDVPCDEPAANVVLVFSRAGRVVARTTTRRDGRYLLTLRPGRYTVTTARRTIGAGLTPRIVLVPRGRVVRVDFDLDTGLR
jgi:hypothetical protein